MLVLVVEVGRDEVELASDALWSLGVVAIEERVVSDDVELWTAVGDDPSAASDVLTRALARWRWRFVDVDASVADTWRRHASPTWVADDLVVCPAWVTCDAPSSAQVIRIEPGPTFGLGDHPTTVLSMRALRSAALTGGSVLDVGCGSGVLSVAACLFGASRVVAVDISLAAVDVTHANAEINGVADRIDVTTTSLADVRGEFDVVVANILAPVLIELSSDLRRLVAPAGTLIVSGVLADGHAHVREELQPMRVIEETTLDGWAALTLRH
jgi:ribosomal protein L11 methyltransferase